MILLHLNDKNEVSTQHHMPFDSIHGLGKTKEELEEEGGIFVESIPEPENRPGKNAVLKYDSGNLFYEYVERPESVEEKLGSLQDENADLMFQNAMQDMSIATLQDENAELMFAIANLQLGGI